MKKCLALLLAFLLCLPLCVDPLSALAEEEPDDAQPQVVTSAILEAMEEPKCRAAAVMDAETGEILYSFHGSEHNFPASITKVMTALLTLEAVDRGELRLEQMVTASDTYTFDLSPDGSTQNIKPGEELSVQELLYCALLPSANEACNILGETVAGDLTSFVDLMNQRAGELGMADTHFANAHGLHNANHYTTAHDIALMVREALGHETFAAIVSTKSHTTPATNLSDERKFVNTNALITAAHYPGYTYANAIGVKTGSTPEAGQCLASAAIKSGRTLICVVLGAENVTDEEGNVVRYSFAESKRLLEWGFENFSSKTVLGTVRPVKEIPVTLSADVSAVALKPQEGIEAILPNDVDPALFQRDITVYQESIEAPVEAGQVLGEMTVRNGDKVYGTVKLVAAASAERSELLYNLDRLQKFFDQTWVKVAILALGVLILILIIRFGIVGSRKRRNRGNRYNGRSRGGYNGRRRR